MFESCKSVEDLCKERMALLHGGANAAEVSVAFNKAKARIMGQSDEYKPIRVYRAKTYDAPLMAAFNYLGPAPKANTIIISQEGIYA